MLTITSLTFLLRISALWFAYLTMPLVSAMNRFSADLRLAYQLNRFHYSSPTAIAGSFRFLAARENGNDGHRYLPMLCFFKTTGGDDDYVAILHRIHVEQLNIIHCDFNASLSYILESGA